MSSSKKLLFIVDDDPMHIQMMQDHLKDKFDFDIRTFSTGEEAVDNLTSNPDIIILDYYLNSVEKSARNGAEILQFIKKEFPEVKVIMVSGQDKMEVAVDTMRYGASDYVIKNPSVFVRTEHAVNKILDESRLQTKVNNYKRLNYVLVAGMIAIIVATIVLSRSGMLDTP